MSDPETILARHRAFWGRADVDRPLVSVSRWPYASITDFEWGLGASSGILDPGMLDVEHFLPQYEARWRDAGAFDGDLLWTAAPPRAIPWMEGILGCPIHYSLGNGAMFAEPALDAWADLADPVLEANPWYEKLLEFVAGLAKLSAGRFPVAMPLLRGPWDLVAGLGGMTRLYLDLYDDPHSVTAVADHLAAVWVEVNRRLGAAIPEWRGGRVGYYGLWAEGLAATTQNDCSVSVSPETYARLMARADRITAQAWPFEVFHLHSAGLHVLESVVTMLGEQALNVAVDPSGPPLDRLIPLFMRLQDRGVRLHLLVFNRDDVTRLVGTLSPVGLAILCWPTD